MRSSLIEPNIENDILAMVRVDKPALLKQLFELGCSYSGQVLSFNKMLGQLQDAGNTTTLAHYLELLAKAGMLTGLQKYTGKPLSQKGSSPKLNVQNTAFMAVYSGYDFERAQQNRELWGRMIESTVGAHLINSSTSDIEVYYWNHSKPSCELDFILKLGNRLISIEVKSGRLRERPTGLAEFKKRYIPEHSLIVGGDNGIKLVDFLSHPTRYWFEQ